MKPKPLHGMRVVEFGTGYVAPVASMYFPAQWDPKLGIHVT